MTRNEFKLYSISAAAKMMGLGRDNVLWLIEQGRLAVIFIKGRQKISHKELTRFVEEATARKPQTDKKIKDEIDLFMTKNHTKKKNISKSIITNEFFTETLQEINYGKCI